MTDDLNVIPEEELAVYDPTAEPQPNPYEGKDDLNQEGDDYDDSDD